MSPDPTPPSRAGAARTPLLMPGRCQRGAVRRGDAERAARGRAPGWLLERRLPLPGPGQGAHQGGAGRVRAGPRRVRGSQVPVGAGPALLPPRGGEAGGGAGFRAGGACQPRV